MVGVPRAGGFLVYPRVRGGEEMRAGGVMKCERYVARRGLGGVRSGGERERWLVQTVRVGGRRPGCDEPERYSGGRRAAGWQGCGLGVYPGVRGRWGRGASGGWDELERYGRGLQCWWWCWVPTFRLVGFPACRFVGKSESWRVSGARRFLGLPRG